MAPLYYVGLARAKVNLNLHVTAQRIDGYHDLSSLVVFPEFGDRIEIFEAEQDEIIFKGRFAPGLDPVRNSLTKTLFWFRMRYHFQRHLKIIVDKNIPVAAGLGGGTADAAQLLRALFALARVNPPRPWELIALGADVPVSFSGRSMIMEGVGGSLTPAPVHPRLGLVLINPLRPLVTSAIFKRFLPPFSPSVHGEWPDIFTETRNDLTPYAVEYSPEVADILALGQNYGTARMSGSGASVFILCDDPVTVAHAIKEARPNYWVEPCFVKENLKSA